MAQNLPIVQEILLKHHQRKHPEIEGPSGAEATIGGCELIQPSPSTKATSSQGLSKSNSKQGRAAASSFRS